jgi:hypothetical protein
MGHCTARWVNGLSLLVRRVIAVALDQRKLNDL